MHVNAVVTIGIPVYKRLGLLPNVLQSVNAQDYPDIELIVSDNGLNGSAVPEIIERNYFRPWRFRQNEVIAEMSRHFNQIIGEASGKYFLLLCDDDEVSPNFISEMVALLQRYPQASVALSRQEIMDEAGRTIRTSSEALPSLVSGPQFIRALWQTSQYKFAGLASFFARTEDLKTCGGYPELWKGHSHDDALVVKLCVDNYVAMSSRATFRFRIYDASHGLSISINDVARATRELLRFVNSDPKLRLFASAHPAEWREVKAIVDRMNWRCYYDRWSGIYRQRLSYRAWIKAAFALPFIPEYYAAVTRTLLNGALNYLNHLLGRPATAR